MYPYYILITSLSAIAYGILFINILSGVFDMWNWFMANGIWILSAASLALSLVLIGRGTLIKKLVGKKNEKRSAAGEDPPSIVLDNLQPPAFNHCYRYCRHYDVRGGSKRGNHNQRYSIMAA